MKKLFAVSLASVVLSALALADTVDNPGPFTETFDAGTLKIGSLNPVPIDQLTIAGSVDSNGNVTIPAESIILPDFVLGSPLGDVTVRFVALADGTGTLNPLTGDASATVSMRIRLIHALFPAACGIGPINATLTTGSDGAFTGVPYMADGTATYVNGTFAVGNSDGCGFYGGAIDSFIGLPSPSGNNWVDGLHGTFNPAFFGS